MEKDLEISIEILKTEIQQSKERFIQNNLGKDENIKEILLEIQNLTTFLEKKIQKLKEKTLNGKRSTLLRKFSKLFSQKTPSDKSQKTPSDKSLNHKNPEDNEWEVDEEGFRVNTQKVIKEKTLDIEFNFKENTLENAEKEDEILKKLQKNLKKSLKSEQKEDGFTQKENGISQKTGQQLTMEHSLTEKSTLKEVAAKRQVLVLIAQGKIVNYTVQGEIILLSSNCKSLKVVGDFKEFVNTRQDLVTDKGDFYEILNGNQEIQIPIFRFIMDENSVFLHVKRCNVVWKGQEDNCLMMFFMFSNEILDKDAIHGLQIKAFIITKRDTHNQDVKVQSKPEGVWDSSCKCLVWDFSDLQETGKVLAKFDGNGISPGTVELSYYVKSSEPRVLVNGGNLAQDAPLYYRYVCT